MAKGPKTARCRSCGAAIYWTTTTGLETPMPVDVEPVPEGNVLLTWNAARRELRSTVMKKGQGAPEPGRNRYVAHFTTCPNASKHRKGGDDDALTPAQKVAKANGHPFPEDIDESGGDSGRGVTPNLSGWR